MLSCVVCCEDFGANRAAPFKCYSCKSLEVCKRCARRIGSCPLCRHIFNQRVSDRFRLESMAEGVENTVSRYDTHIYENLEVDEFTRQNEISMYESSLRHGNVYTIETLPFPRDNGDFVVQITDEIIVYVYYCNSMNDARVTVLRNFVREKRFYIPLSHLTLEMFRAHIVDQCV